MLKKFEQGILGTVEESLLRSARKWRQNFQFVTLSSSSHFHDLDAGSVTVLISDYPWDIRPGSIDMTVMFRDQLARCRSLDFSVARFSTCSRISFLL